MNAPSAPLNVLIVEDDLFFQKVIEEALGALGRPLVIERAASVAQASTCIHSGTADYNLALVDLGLPDGDGIAVIQSLSEQFPDTHIVVISVGSEEDRVLEAVRAGATGYVLKGDSNLTLHHALHQVLGGLSPISPMLAGYFLKLAASAPKKTAAPGLKLTPREIDLLEKFSQGLSYQQAARKMGVALSTVQTHTRGLYRKLGVRSSLQALSKARHYGLL